MLLTILLQVGHGHEWEFHLGDTATYQSFCSWKKPYHSHTTHHGQGVLLLFDLLHLHAA